MSYAFSTSNIKTSFDYSGKQKTIDNIKTQAIEISLYNTYIQDEGWYNDSLIKIGYFIGHFKIHNFNYSLSTNNQTQNIAITLSNEVGYQFKLGKSKEWGIVPQIQLGFSYFNQGRFKQTLKNSPAYLISFSNALLTLRTKFGLSFGYDFKHFVQNVDLSPILYMALFYEYDYINGGKIHMSTQRGTQAKKSSDISSDGRFLLNLGFNLGVGDNTRIYFDFQKSFAGKITTEYQINLGVRYSFGEKI